MKKYTGIIFLSAMSAIAGCTIEESFLQEEENNPSGEVITIRATREGDPDTRTVRKSDGKVWWVPGDAISLFYGSGADGGSKFTSTGTDTSQVTNFTGTITAITGGGELTVDDTYFWGVYPYNDDVSCDGSSVTMTIPTQQTAVPGTFATNTFPSIGKSRGLIMGFYNVCGGWRFSVTKEGVRKVTLKSGNGEKITGKVKVGFNDSGVPEIKEVIDGSDEVVLECPRGEYFEVGKNYYMTILPTVFSSGFTMTFETYTEEGVYRRTAKTTITRSNFSGIANLDNYLTTPYAQKTGNIPIEDANFKAYLVSNFDSNGDGEISYEEAEAIIDICTDNDEIESVQGIEFMPYLWRLICSGDYAWANSATHEHSSSGKLKYIDVSNNRCLSYLSCGFNQLTVLNVSANVKLTTLYCSYNNLDSLDISNNSELVRLDCSYNKLTYLNISNNNNLVYLYCGENLLSCLDVSNNRGLMTLACYYNKLTQINVSNNVLLTQLVCDYNQFTDLDVSKNSALTSLGCSGNKLTSLDLSNNTELSNLTFGQDYLTSLDLSHNVKLTKLTIKSGSNLKYVDVSDNIALTQLICSGNTFTSLDLSKNLLLEWLDCSSNQLNSLDVSKNTKLRVLDCSSNQLTTLEVSKNAALTILHCDSNQLTTLDISKNTALKTLWCASNQLTTLDVSKNTALTYLSCSQMSTLITLYIYQDQEIPKVTTDRNTNNIPETTEIKVATPDGGNEGTGDEELNP